MHLLKALSGFSTKRVTRLALPKVTVLRDACVGFEGTVDHQEDAQERLQRVLGLFKVSEAALLDRRDIRFITAAIGSSKLIDEIAASRILAEVERRNDKRLLRAVFRALLASYREKSLRSLIRAFVRSHVDDLPSDARRFSEQSGILKGDEYLQRLGGDLSRSKDIPAYCVSKGITSNVLASNYGTELKLAAIRDAAQAANAKSVQQLISWVFSGNHGTPIGDYYEAMLSPFETNAPSPDVQKILMSTLVVRFGDPRIGEWPGLEGKDGGFRRDVCVATIKRWLSIEYLDLFIKIIEKTAEDRQFKPRKAFWLKYFEKGVISDLTLALASDANAIARKMRSQADNAEYMQWANLKRALPNQSVLLMRLGDLIIAEWSHSGAMQFWSADNKTAPEFHSKEYFSSTLRNGSLKVKVGNEFRDALIHYENGQWMTWARNAIEYHTGVSV